MPRRRRSAARTRRGRKPRVKPRTQQAKPLSALSPESQLARERALEALSLMRAQGFSLTRAAQQAQTTTRTVRKYVSRALVKEKGHLRAKPSDGLERRLRFLTVRGIIELRVRSSRTATRIAQYWNAVDHYLKTGNTSLLRPFRGKTVRAGKVGYPFLTDPRTLNRLALAGEVTFEDLYALAA